MASEEQACLYMRQIKIGDQTMLALRCTRYKHPDNASSFNASGRGGNHRTELASGVIVYFESEPANEEAPVQS